MERSWHMAVDCIWHIFSSLLWNQTYILKAFPSFCSSTKANHCGGHLRWGRGKSGAVRLSWKQKSGSRQLRHTEAKLRNVFFWKATSGPLVNILSDLLPQTRGQPQKTHRVWRFADIFDLSNTVTQIQSTLAMCMNVCAYAFTFTCIWVLEISILNWEICLPVVCFLDKTWSLPLGTLKTGNSGPCSWNS